MFGAIPPAIGMGIANYFSRKSRTTHVPEQFLGEENEWLLIYSKAVLQKEHYDYFIFGHRHIAIEYPLPQNSMYVNLGDWIKYNSYAEFDGKDLRLKYYKAK